MTDVLKKRGIGHRDTQGEGDVRMKAEINQGDDSTSQGTPKIIGAERAAWSRLPSWSLRTQPCRHLDLGFLILRNVRIRFCCVSYPVCGRLLIQPRKHIQ